jgi:hypothetical protein
MVQCWVTKVSSTQAVMCFRDTRSLWYSCYLASFFLKAHTTNVREMQFTPVLSLDSLTHLLSADVEVGQYHVGQSIGCQELR